MVGMNRVTAIICGVLLFGFGLFLGMLGSFVRTLAPESPPAPRKAAAAISITNPPPGALRPRPAAPPSPSATESTLSEAMAMIAVALSLPPSSPPPASETPPEAPANPPEPPSLDTVVADAVDGPVPMDPLAATPASPSSTPSPPPMVQTPLMGHWVFDPQLGWVWLPENNTTVVIVPMVEFIPAGLITINRPAKAVTVKKTATSPPKSPSTPQARSTTPQPTTPVAKPTTTSSPKK